MVEQPKVESELLGEFNSATAGGRLSSYGVRKVESCRKKSLSLSLILVCSSTTTPTLLDSLKPLNQDLDPSPPQERNDLLVISVLFWYPFRSHGVGLYPNRSHK